MTFAQYLASDDTKQNQQNSAVRVGQNNQQVTPGETTAQLALAMGKPYVSSYETAYWNSVAAKSGMTVPQVVSWLQAHPGPTATQLIQGAMSANTAGLEPDSLADKILQKVALTGSIAAITAGVGAGIGAAAGGAIGSGVGAVGSGPGAILGGVAQGAGGAALGNLVTAGGKGIGQAALLGGLSGGLTQGVNQLGGTSGIANATGLPSPVAAGLVKGVVGAGLSAAGGGGLNGAAAGGVGGFLSGAVGNATGISALGTAASGLGGLAIAPLLSSSNGNSGSSATASSGMNYLGAAGGQGNNTGMANINIGGGSAVGLTGAGSGSGSTDSTLAGTITGALPGLLQGAAGVYGSQNAAQALTNADTNAINTQQSTLGNINNIWSTQQNLGQGAQTALGSALGTNGQPANYSGFQNMPGYQFAVQQGTQAIQRQAASLGNAYTPNTAAAVGQYVTGTAAQDYNTYISQLMGAAGLGSTANAGIATPTYQTGANISTLQQNQGYAQASGVSGAANAVGGLFGANGAGTSLIGAAGKFLGGGSSGGSSGSAGSSSDPFAGTSLANNQNAINQYNQNNVGNTGVDPSTGQPWASGVAPVTTPVDTGSLNTIDTGSMGDTFGDGGDALDFLGGT